MKLNLGENIRLNRRRLDLTQEQLADRLGVSFQSISRWETGATYPDMELLPVMAKLFSVTVDELLGYNEPEEKTPYREIEDALGNALKACDIEESVRLIRLIRLIRLDYLDDVYRNAGCSSLNYANLSDAYKNPEVIAEVRRLTEDYLRLGKGGGARSCLIENLVDMIDDEHLEEVLGQHSTEHADLSRDSLLLRRYRYRRETEKQTELEQILRYIELNRQLIPKQMRRRDGTRDFALGCRCAENALAMLHAMNETVPDKAHPLTGDGSVDLWTGIRLHIGYDYMVCLCNTGRTEEALIVLEDFIQLIEHAVALPNGTEITCRSPQFSDFKLTKWNNSDKTDRRVILVEYRNAAERMCEAAYVFSYEYYLPKYVPLGDTPQFAEACRRLTDCLKNGCQPDDISCTVRK